MYSDFVLQTYRDEHIKGEPTKLMLEAGALKRINSEDPIAFIEDFFKKTKLFKDRGYLEFIKTVSMLSQFQEVSEASLRLPENLMETILKNVWLFDDEGLAGYIYLIERVGYPCFLEVDIFSEDSINSFKNTVLSIETQKRDSFVFDINSEISKEFSTLASRYKIDSSYLEISSLFLMLLIFGERKMIEALTKYAAERSAIGTIELIRILDNWDELKNQPLDWAVEMGIYMQ
jgi:hypothetical protein